MIKERIGERIYGFWGTPGGITKRLERAVENRVRQLLVDLVSSPISDSCYYAIEVPILLAQGATRDLHDR